MESLRGLHTKSNWSLYENIRTGFSLEDAAIALVCCLLIFVAYNIMEASLSTVKQKAWIIMLVSSTVLSICGIFYVARAQYFQLWTNEHIYAEDFLSRCIMLFFLSSNIMDLVLGVQYYPKFLDPLSTISHHIFYILFITTLLACHYSRGFILCFFMEIPTCLLAIGTIWERARSDALFGMSFLATRILYNIYLAYRLFCLSPEGVIWKICVSVLGLHLFWFSKWMKTYGYKALETLLS